MNSSTNEKGLVKNECETLSQLTKKPSAYTINIQKKTLNIDRNDPDLRIFADQVGIDIDDDVDRKPKRIFRLDHLTPAFIEDPPIPNGHILGGHYGFPSEYQLKEKYSTKTFDFLSNVVKEYELFLKNNPSQDYSRVSDLMIRSEQKLSDEESKKIRHYDDKYLRAQPKTSVCESSRNNLNKAKGIKSGKVTETDRKVNEAIKHYHSVKSKHHEDKFFGYYTLSENERRDTKFLSQDFEKRRCGPLTQSEVAEARNLGLLDLSHRSLITIPERIWSIDVITDDDRKAYETNNEISMHPSMWCTFKSLISLNLSHNSLTSINPQGTTLISLKELRITNNMLEKLPDDIDSLKNLTFLDLDTNSLTGLPYTFSRLQKLEELKLKRNFIEKLPENFDGLINLKKLNLSFNKITKIPDCLTYLNCLEFFDVSFNKLSGLPKNFKDIKSLKVVDISYNKVTHLPLMKDVTKLTIFNATSNMIREFPNFSGCKLLTELRIGGNNIKKIVIEYLKGCSLIELIMENNKVDVIPDNLYNIVPMLISIDFSYNRLNWLPWSLAYLKYLTRINVDSNNITNIENEILLAGSNKIIQALREKLIMYESLQPASQTEENGSIYKKIEVFYEKNSKNIPKSLYSKDMIAELKTTRCLVRQNMRLTDFSLTSDLLKIAKEYKIFRVDLTNNCLSYIPTSLDVLNSCLTELILKENQLKSIPAFIGRMNLIHLDISNNFIDSFPLSLGSSKLKTLTARNNCFSSVPKIVYSITTLEKLDFEGNSIIEIDSDRLKNLRKLTYLNLNNNLIQKFPTGLTHLTNLKVLNVSNNPLKRQSFEVLKKNN